MSDDAELLIAGGGLNGLLLGIACAGAGLEVVLVDREDPAAMLEQGFDGRSSAIAYGSQQVLSALGLWPAIAADAEPILEIRVADDNAPFFLHYDHRELGTDAPLGWIVENRVLRRANGLIAVSENTRRDAINILKLPEDRIVAIHPGIAPRFFDVAQSAITRVKADLKLEKPYVLSVGTIKENIQRFVDGRPLINVVDKQKGY